MGDKLKAIFDRLFTGIGGQLQIFVALVTNFFGDTIDALGMVITDPATIDQMHQATPPGWVGHLTKGLAGVTIVVKIRNAWKVARKIGGAS